MVMTAVSQESAAIAVPVKSEARASTSYHRTTQHEEPSRAFEVDVIVQLKSNLAQLEDLHARMQFLMGEIGYLLKTT